MISKCIFILTEPSDYVKDFFTYLMRRRFAMQNKKKCLVISSLLIFGLLAGVCSGAAARFLNPQKVVTTQTV